MLYNINKIKLGDKITRTIGTDLRFNVLPSAGTLKCYFWNWIGENFMTTKHT
jgi:hypothetical protein